MTSQNLGESMWSIARWQELLQHLPNWSPLSQVPVCRIWWELDLFDHQTNDIIIGIGEIFLVNPTNITACCTKAPARVLVYWIDCLQNVYTWHKLSWTTLVVHSRDIDNCGGAPWRKFTLKPAKIPYITIWQYWLGNTKPKKAFRLILNPFKKLLQNFLKNLLNGIFYWLTN